jgi:hypothetical protein
MSQTAAGGFKNEAQHPYECGFDASAELPQEVSGYWLAKSMIAAVRGSPSGAAMARYRCDVRD